MCTAEKTINAKLDAELNANMRQRKTPTVVLSDIDHERSPSWFDIITISEDIFTITSQLCDYVTVT